MNDILSENQESSSEQLQNTQCDYKIEIINYRDVPFELASDSFANLMIEESMFDEDVVKGHISIIDTTGIEERVPLIGQERIRIEFNNKLMPKTKYQGTFVIHKISEKLVVERKQTYILHFISEEFINNLKRKVSKSFKGKRSSEIVSEIYERYLVSSSSPKKLFFDKIGNSDGTFYPMHFVFPSVRPFSAINQVAKSSVASNAELSEESKIIPNFGSFVFFENKFGFWFKSIADLIDPQTTTEQTEFNKQSVESTNEKGSDYNQLSQEDRENQSIVAVDQAPSTVNLNVPVAKYIIAPQNTPGMKLSTGEFIVNSYKFISTFDSVSNLAAGMYNSKLLTYDPVTQIIGANKFEKPSLTSLRNSKILKGNKRAVFYEYNYLDEFKNFRHVRSDKTFPVISRDHFAYGESDSFYKYQSTNFEHNQIGSINTLQNVMTDNSFNCSSFDKQVERYLLPHYAQKRMMKNIIVEIRVSGDHNRTIGEVVELKLPSYFFNDDHKFYSGNYLITNLRHLVTSDNSYITEMQLVRDSLLSPIETVEPPQEFLQSLEEDENFWENEIGDE